MGIDNFFDDSKPLGLPLREVETEEDIKKYHLDITDEEFAKRLCIANNLRYIPEDTECLLNLIRKMAYLYIDKGLISEDFKMI